MRVSDQRRSELREAVQSHRAAQRAEVQREEAIAGRRLTAAERLELREQLRRQWFASTGVRHSAESQPAERLMPVPVPPPMPVAETQRLRPMPPAARSQRP